MKYFLICMAVFGLLISGYIVVRDAPSSPNPEHPAWECKCGPCADLCEATSWAAKCDATRYQLREELQQSAAAYNLLKSVYERMQLEQDVCQLDRVLQVKTNRRRKEKP